MGRCYNAGMPARPRKKRLPDFGLPEPEICLAFANTALPGPTPIHAPRTRKAPPPVEDFSGLVDWGVHVGLLEDTAARQLRGAAAVRPADATHAFDEAHRLRALLVRLLTTMAREGSAAPEHVEALRPFLDGCRVAASPASAGGGFVPRVDGAEGFGRVASLVAGAALRLVTAPPPTIVRRCAGTGCGRFLLQNHWRERRWCDLGLCRDREKARRRRRLG